MARKPLNTTQCVLLTLAWAGLCFIVLTTAPRIDGPLVVALLISFALVFIPIAKAIRKRKREYELGSNTYKKEEN